MHLLSTQLSSYGVKAFGYTVFHGVLHLAKICKGICPSTLAASRSQRLRRRRFRIPKIYGSSGARNLWEASHFRAGQQPDRGLYWHSDVKDVCFVASASKKACLESVRWKGWVPCWLWTTVKHSVPSPDIFEEFHWLSAIVPKIFDTQKRAEDSPLAVQPVEGQSHSGSGLKPASCSILQGVPVYYLKGKLTFF